MDLGVRNGEKAFALIYKLSDVSMNIDHKEKMQSKKRGKQVQ